MSQAVVFRIAHFSGITPNRRGEDKDTKNLIGSLRRENKELKRRNLSLTEKLRASTSKLSQMRGGRPGGRPPHQRIPCPSLLVLASRAHASCRPAALTPRVATPGRYPEAKKLLLGGFSFGGRAAFPRPPHSAALTCTSCRKA